MDIGRFKQIAFLLALLSGFACLAAQRFQIRAFAEPTIIGKDEQLTFTIEISGEKGFRAETPKVPELKDFVFRNMMTTTSTQFSIINGRMSESLTKSFVFNLLPKRPGNLSIPSFDMVINGKSYNTDVVSVRVLDSSIAGKSPSQQARPYGYGQRMPLFMPDPFDLDLGFEPVGEMSIVAIPDKKSVFVGEPLLVTYRLYTTQPVSALELKEEKDFGGYGKEVYSEPSRLNFETTKFKNQRYQTAVIKTLAISPNRAGVIELPRITAVAQIGRMGLFTQSLQSESVSINVKELPLDNKPPDFTGAVGSIKVSESMEKSLVRIGETLEYRLIISGNGNFNQFSNPEYPAQQSFRIAIPVTENKVQAGVSGTRTIIYTLIPKHEGKYKLPGVSFNWFDPAKESYQSFKSVPNNVEVKQGNVLTYISNVFQKDNIRTLTPFNPKHEYKSSKLFINSPLYWMLTVLFILSLVPSWLYSRNKKLKDTDPDLAAQRSSDKILRKYLKQAEKSAMDYSKEFYPHAEKGLMRYLSDKYHIPHRLSIQEKLYQMRLKGLDEELIQKLEEFLKRCQEARYMPGGFNEQVLSEDLIALKRVIREFTKLSYTRKIFQW